MRQTLQQHWREYLIEAFCLGSFMMAAGVFATLLNAEASPIPELLPSEWGRRLLMGLAMGTTAITIIYSPWGKRKERSYQSCSHFNVLSPRKTYPLGCVFFMSSSSF